MTQFASVEGNFPDSITCVCGNTCSSSGMIQCNEDGIAFHVYSGNIPDGLVEMPEDPAKLYMVCPDCGALYSDQTIIETASAPVIKTVNIVDGPAAESFKVHWALGD